MNKKLLTLQTGESGMIEIVSSCLESEESLFKYSIYDYDGEEGKLWEFDFSSIDECLNHLERCCISDGFFLSWWLFTNVIYINNDMNSKLNERIQRYKKNGLLEIAYLKRYECFSDYSNNFIVWLTKAGYDVTNEIFRQKPKKSLLLTREVTIETYFEGFNKSICSRFVSFKINKNKTLQQLLDYIYNLIRNEVRPFSYGSEWFLIDLYSQSYLEKTHSESSTINSIGLQKYQKFICKKIAKQN